MRTEFSPELDAAWKAEGRADNALRELMRDRDEWVREQRSRIEAEAGERFGAAIREAQAEVDRCEALRHEQEEREALAKPRVIPAGTLMEEWQPEKRGYHNYGDPKPTGRRGILEIVTRETVHPGNRYAAHIGAVVIRVIKKDGTPGRDYVSGDYEITNYWRPTAEVQP